MSAPTSALTKSLSAAEVRARLEVLTPAGVALVNATNVVVASWLVDSYATRGGDLVLTKTDGSQIRRRVLIRTNSTTGADATTCKIASSGIDTHADLTIGDWIDCDLSGAGTAQLARLLIKAAANGSSWSARFVPDFLKAS